MVARGELVFPVADLCEMRLVLSSREDWKVCSQQLAAFAPALLGCNVRRGKTNDLNVRIVFCSTAQVLGKLYLQCIYPFPFQLPESTWKAYCCWGACCFTCEAALGWGAAVDEEFCTSQGCKARTLRTVGTQGCSEVGLFFMWPWPTTGPQAPCLGSGFQFYK